MKIDSILSKKAAKFLLKVTILANVILICLGIGSGHSVFFQVPTTFLAFYLLYFLSNNENVLINYCSLFMAYPSILQIINFFYPFNFVVGFILFLPELIALIILIRLLIIQKKWFPKWFNKK